MHNVFISHSSKDRVFVENELVPFLKLHDIQTWYALDDIRTADEWERKVHDGLISCDWFLVVMTPKSVASDWVQTEVHWAIDNRRGRIIPLLLHTCDPTDLHLKLPRIQYVDFRGDRDTAFHDLLVAWTEQHRAQRPTVRRTTTQPISKWFLASIVALIILALFAIADPFHLWSSAELTAGLTLNYGHMFALTDGITFMGQKKMGDAPSDDGLPGLNLSVVNTGGQVIMFNYPTIDFKNKAKYAAMGFPINPAMIKEGVQTTLQPGNERSFPLYYGLMAKDFDFFADEFIRSNIESIYVAAPDGRRAYVPQDQVDAACAYFKHFFGGRNLGPTVDEYKKRLKARSE